jgi:dolichyl-phosphate beta-glucosyltransferase
MQLSIIIPCYNEAETLKTTLPKLAQFKYWNPQTELIIVDDGSEDATAQNINAGSDFIVESKYVVDQFITYKPNQGKGYAIRRGIEKATYNTIVLLDADLSVQPNEIEQAITDLFTHQPLQEACMVQGERVQIVKQPLKRIIAGKIFKCLVYFKTGIWHDTQCPFKILHNIPKDILQYKTDGFAFDVELIKRIKDTGIPIVYQRVPYFNRLASKVTLWKTAKMLIELLKI